MSQQNLIDGVRILEEDEPLEYTNDKRGEMLLRFEQAGLVKKNQHRVDFLDNLYHHCLAKADMVLLSGREFGEKYSILPINFDLRFLYKTCFEGEEIGWGGYDGAKPPSMFQELRDILILVRNKIRKVSDATVKVKSSRPNWNYGLKIQFHTPTNTPRLVENPLDHLMTVDVDPPTEEKARAFARDLLHVDTHHLVNDLEIWKFQNMKNVLTSNATRYQRFFEFGLGALFRLRKKRMAIHKPTLRSYIGGGGEYPRFEDPKVQALAELVDVSPVSLDAKIAEVEERRSDDVEGSGE